MSNGTYSFELPGHQELSSGVKYLLAFVIVVLLVQNPFEIYLIFHEEYKMLYALAFMAFISVALYVGPQHLLKIASTKYLVSYCVFVGLSLICLLLNSLTVPNIQAQETLQFVARLFQFYVVYNIAHILGPIVVLGWIYRSAVVFACLGVVYSLLNYFGMSSPIPDIRVFAYNGDMFYSFPFGFTEFQLPQDPAYFRLYSYFTEPGHFAFYEVLFLVYALYMYVDLRLLRYAISALLIVAAIFFTASTGGLFTIVLICAFVLMRSLLHGITAGRAFVILLFLLVFLGTVLGIVFYLLAGGGADNTAIFRRALSMENRGLEWAMTANQILDNPFGFGIGGYLESSLSFELADIVKEYRGPTNILQVIYYIGAPYIIPLVLFFGSVFIWAARTSSKAPVELRMVSAMVVAALFFSASINVVFNAVFQTVLAAFFILSAQNDIRQHTILRLDK